MSGFAPAEPFALTEHEKASILWARLKDHLLDELDAARRSNDAPRTEQETATLRGDIRRLKRIIALGDDRPPLTGDEEAPRGASMME